MTSVDESKPMNMPMTASKSNLGYEGLVLKKGSGNALELATAKGDQCVAILDQAFVDSTQTARTTASGDELGVFFIGSGKIVKVASQTTLTWATGDTCFISDASDGLARNATETSSRPIGHYVGTGTTTTADYDLVTVILDVAQVEALKVIYNGSTLLSVMDKAGIPTRMVDETEVIEDAVKGVAGEDQVAIDALVEPSRMTYRQIKTSIKWSNYTYDILEGGKLHARDPKAVWSNNIKSAAEYFAAIKDYRSLSAIVGCANNTAAAGAVWSSEEGDPEEDIVAGISKLMEKSNMQFGEKISCIVPAKVFYEVNKLTLIKNIQRTIKDYLESSFDLSIIPYRPMVNDAGTAIYDGLSTSAVMFVQGNRTAEQIVYSPAAAAAKRILLVEQGRMLGRGDRYINKMGTACLPAWDGVATYTSSTNYKNNRIYTITSVTS
jgi:hypothetical protein